MQVSVIQNHMVETESKGFHAILTPVVINMYTQVLLKRNPGFPIFLLLGLPNFVSTTLSSRKTSNTQETANNFSNKSQARGWLWLAMETWATRAHVCMLCYSERTKPEERKRTEGTMPSSRQLGLTQPSNCGRLIQFPRSQRHWWTQQMWVATYIIP